MGVTQVEGGTQQQVSGSGMAPSLYKSALLQIGAHT